MARRRRHRQAPSEGAGGADSPAGSGVRDEVAQLAARLMAEEGIHGFAEAKAKAASELGVAGRQSLPGNDEIEAALREYQALFQGDEQSVWLAEKRRIALDAMALLARFQPLLAGAVLRGTVVEDGEITLHVFVEPPETVATFLYERGIPWELDSWVGRFGGGRTIELPVYRIVPDGHELRLVVFPEEGLREAPRSPVDGRPMARATRARVAALLEPEGGDPHGAAQDPPGADLGAVRDGAGRRDAPGNGRE